MSVSNSAITPRTSADSLLRMAMRADAVLTGLTGVVMALAARPLSPVTGLPVAVEYGFAAFMVTWGVVVFWLATLPSLRRPGIGVIVGNLACTVAAVAVVLIGVWPLTTIGVVLLLASGVYTAVFAELQYKGLRRLAA